jgi:subfamily B ATP-binding cassette protein MsbA
MISLLAEMLLSILELLLLIFALVNQQQASSGVDPAFVAIILFNKGMHAMMSIQMSLQQTMDRIGAVEMVDREFDKVASLQESSGTIKQSKLTDGIEYKQVSFSYGADEAPALRDINLKIPARSTVALVGESGAGKSTLVDTLSLLLKPGKGHIYIDGNDSREVDVYSWRRQIGYVSQETVVFDDTVANNICMWSGDYANDAGLREKTQEAARKAYAHNFIMDLPNGYDTKVGDRGCLLRANCLNNPTCLFWTRLPAPLIRNRSDIYSKV